MFLSSGLRILINNHLLVRIYNSLYKICNKVNKQGWTERSGSGYYGCLY